MAYLFLLSNCPKLPTRFTADVLLPSPKPSQTTSKSKEKCKHCTRTGKLFQGFSALSIHHPEYPSQHIDKYVADPTNPNPPYMFYTVEESIKSHTNNMAAYLDAFDATMAK
jgi:hypothetical protein